MPNNGVYFPPPEIRDYLGGVLRLLLHPPVTPSEHLAAAAAAAESHLTFVQTACVKRFVINMQVQRGNVQPQPRLRSITLRCVCMGAAVCPVRYFYERRGSEAVRWRIHRVGAGISFFF